MSRGNGLGRGKGTKRTRTLTAKGEKAVKQRGLTDQVVEQVRWRSKGRCEAWFDTGPRCPNPGQHHHHMLLKSRGGRILDRESVSFHLALLCHECHERCHRDQSSGFRSFDAMPLIVRGEVTERNGYVEYIGEVDRFDRALRSMLPPPEQDA